MSRHQAAVLETASHLLDPEPHEYPHELRVSAFVDSLLSVLRVAPDGLHAVGSLRHRVAELRDQYRNGVALLDELAGGDFTAVAPMRQQLILAQGQLAAFAGLLFGHIIEAMGHTEREGADLRFR